MKKAIIMRGIPGSGKSTLAAELAGKDGIVHATDSYFMKDGKYQFDLAKKKSYQKKNFEAFCKSIDAGISPVIFDATNARKKDYVHYFEKAHKSGYQVQIIALPHLDVETAYKRTDHGDHTVPKDAIQERLDNWEY